jgi:hypothetical protein
MATPVLQCNIAYLLTDSRLRRRERHLNVASQHKPPSPAMQEFALTPERLSTAGGEEDWTR